MNNRDEKVYENLKEEKINVDEIDSPLFVCFKYRAYSYPKNFAHFILLAFSGFHFLY